jgi:hypothetical protein
MTKNTCNHKPHTTQTTKKKSPRVLPSTDNTLAQHHHHRHKCNNTTPPQPPFALPTDHLPPIAATRTPHAASQRITLPQHIPCAPQRRLQAPATHRGFRQSARHVRSSSSCCGCDEWVPATRRARPSRCDACRHMQQSKPAQICRSWAIWDTTCHCQNATCRSAKPLPCFRCGVGKADTHPGD